MKNQIKPIITILFLAASFAINARTLPAAPTVKTFAASMYKVVNTDAVNLYIDKLQGSKLKLELLNKNGEIIYTQNLSKKATKFRTKFNMEALEKGKYFLKITNGNTTEIRNIEI